MNKSIIIPFINKETRAVILVSSQWSEHVYYTFDHDEVNNKHVRTTPVIALSVCSYHVMYVFQSESTLYSCLNVKEFLARSRREIWSLSDCNWTRTQNHLVHKRTLNHLAKMAYSAELAHSALFLVLLFSAKPFFNVHFFFLT